MQQLRQRHAAALIMLLGLSLLFRSSATSPGVCPNVCDSLPEKQKTAAGLAVSMVVMTTCNGDIEGAARAVASAAADGDLHAFSAGLSVGAAALTGPDEQGRGQMAQILSQTLSVADSKNKTTAVASALGNALAAMNGTAAEALAAEAVDALDDMAADVSCTAATRSAASLYFSVKHSNATLAAHFLAAALKSGDPCWVRRLSKLKASPVFNLPPPTSPCTQRMQAASATSVSLVTASSCRLDKSKPVAAAAYALVTAAVKDGCSFASAVAASTEAGLPKDAVKDIYTAAITRAGVDKKQSQLGNAFAAVFNQLDSSSNASELLDTLLAAVDRTIAVSGCKSAKAFTRGLFSRLVQQDPSSVKSLKQTFLAKPSIGACKYPL